MAVYLFTAIYPEAEPLIRRFALKRVTSPLPWQQFASPSGEVVLTITGTGPVQAAAAVGGVLSGVSAGGDGQSAEAARQGMSGAYLALIGTAAGTPGTEGMFRVNKLTNADSGRSFYPDILVPSAFPEAEIVTSSRIMTAGEIGKNSRIAGGPGDSCAGKPGSDGEPSPLLFDMEAAAVCEAALKFLGPHQMTFLKLVSDHGIGEAPAAREIAAAIDRYAEDIASLLAATGKLGRRQARRGQIFTPEQDEKIRRLKEDIHASDTMCHQLEQMLTYAGLSGTDWENWIREQEIRGVLPARDRRTGKALLGQLQRTVLHGQNTIARTPAEEAAAIGRFSHIYVEREVLHHPLTERILRRYPRAEVVVINHYKDVFNRSRQDIALQYESQNLILAAKHGTLIYPGAPVCQDFGSRHFYYTSSVMNCVFNCEYCYLKGMYPSGNTVIFVNLEDTFAAVDRLLAKHPVYLCVSYDTDLVALEPLLGYVKRWTEFAGTRENLSIEIRTKGAVTSLWDDLTPGEGSIFAFTLSPDEVSRRFEHGAASLSARIASICRGMAMGFPVRIAFDPMIFVPDWKQAYAGMLDEVFARVPMDKVRDVSVGSFRISKEYLKPMRRALPDSAVVQYPFVTDRGYCHYPGELEEEMETYLTGRLAEVILPEKIFRWE